MVDESEECYSGSSVTITYESHMHYVIIGTRWYKEAIIFDTGYIRWRLNIAKFKWLSYISFLY